jgi:aldose 1-epimerase
VVATDPAAAAPGSVAAGLELRSGELRLALRPDIGGSVAGLWHGELPVWRSQPPQQLTQPRAGACFPLVPYSNRLGHRRFRWQGHDYTTLPNFEDSPHSLHGVGWRRPWQVRSDSAAAAEIGFEHAPDGDWPFAFAARQSFALTPDSIELRLSIENTDARTQPVGLGWHPYFVRRARSRLHIELTERWDKDALALPTRRVAQPGIDAEVAHLDFDHCFEGWRGAARIRDEKLSLRLTSSLSRLVVFTPRERDFFCVEPVSHVNNAVHMAEPAAHGLIALAPGAAASAWMRLEIDALK